MRKFWKRRLILYYNEVRAAVTGTSMWKKVWSDEKREGQETEHTG